jgi:hypothetical protein
MNPSARRQNEIFGTDVQSDLTHVAVRKYKNYMNEKL